ncbi:type II secretion system F family protein, partial [Dermatophilus congolensis]
HLAQENPMISAWIPALLTAAAITLWPTQHPTNTHPNHIPTSPRHAFTAWKKQRHRDSHTGIEKDLLNVVEALSGALRAGLPPAAALALAREGITGKLGNALTTVEHRARMGEGLAAGWSEAARRINNPELALLARAWSLSEETGTPPGRGSPHRYPRTARPPRPTRTHTLSHRRRQSHDDTSYPLTRNRTPARPAPGRGPSPRLQH